MQSRYYNSELGRFISRDDESYHDDAIGAAANLYVYCRNNPVINVDPSGKWAISLLCYQLSCGGIFGFLLAVALAFDGKRNVGLLFTVGVGAATPSFGFSSSGFAFYWVKTIFDLSGISYIIGGSTAILNGKLNIGVDITLDNKGRFMGISVGLGVGGITTYEGHALGTVSVYLIQLNTKSWASNLYKAVKLIHVNVKTHRRK